MNNVWKEIDCVKYLNINNSDWLEKCEVAQVQKVLIESHWWTVECKIFF